jgi:hypothetical protein
MQAGMKSCAGDHYGWHGRAAAADKQGQVRIPVFRDGVIVMLRRERRQAEPVSSLSELRMVIVSRQRGNAPDTGLS